MAEEDCEIEYLDEDEDIIHQFVQNAPIVENKPTTTAAPANYDKNNRDSDITDIGTETDEDVDDENIDSLVEKKSEPLLVEKKRSDVKRKLKSEDDTDYDPREEIRQARHIQAMMRKRRRTVKNSPANVQIPIRAAPQPKTAPTSPSLSKDIKKLAGKLISEFADYDIKARRKKGIRIPDFEDPLCLPVKSICNSKYDWQKLKNWNRVCLEHYKKNFDPFKPSEEPVVASSRTTIFKKVKNKSNGQSHTTVWNKIQVEDSNGKEKSEVNQYTLPFFREKIILKPYSLATGAGAGTPRRFQHKHEVLLTKETNKDEEYLVAYNPGDAVTAVYKEFKQDDKEAQSPEADEKQSRLVIKETTCNKMCAPCYQTSWRSVRKRDDTALQCAVCQRHFVTAYNLLAHLKANHKHAEVRRHRAALARTLATVVDYHYRCRICQETFLSIKLLRKHVAKHQGHELFHCEIGNHVAK